MIAAAIIVAGGSGKRFGSRLPKQFLKLNGKPIFLWSVEAFLSLKEFRQVIVVVPQEIVDNLKKEYSDPSPDKQSLSTSPARGEVKTTFCAGGKERFHSVANGLKLLDEKVEFVAIHDGARPLINKQDILKVLKAAQKSKAAIAVEKTKDTIKIVKNGNIINTPDRQQLWNAQTPQIFKKDLILKAYSKKIPNNTTDDAQLVERLKIKVAAIETNNPNFKITTKQDFELAKKILP